MKKKVKSTLLLTLAAVSLLTIGLIVGVGFFKTKPNVLGESSEFVTPTPFVENLTKIIQNTIQGTIDTTKETVSERIVEAEKTIMNEVQKEVNSLTESQVKALKVQICTDLGVITNSPTKSP